MNNSVILKSFLPEILFSLTILTQIVLNTKLISTLKHNYPILEREVLVQSLFSLVLATSIFIYCRIEGFLSTNLLSADSGSLLVKIIFVIFCIASLFLVFLANRIEKINFSEYYYITSLALMGLFVMISTNNLLMFYLTMEIQTLCFYILAAINRNSLFSIEAGLKYFISGSFMSGIYLLGCSLIYGSLGSINIGEVRLLLDYDLNTYNNFVTIFAISGVILITVTLLFKLSCVPFHFWAPDVYEGSPISSTALFSILPKFAIFYFFMKWINSLGVLSENITYILIVLGVCSCFLGTLYALSQTRFKRLIVYSSIAQTGFLICGLGCLTVDGYAATFFFLILYLMSSLLTWGHFVVFYLFSQKSNHVLENGMDPLQISTITNFHLSNTLWAFSLILIFFSSGGVPPLGGFLSKNLIILELIKEFNVVTGIVLMVISSVSVYYYIRVIKISYFEPKEKMISQQFKSTYFDKYYDYFNQGTVFLLIVILVVFYNPSIVEIFGQYVVINALNF